jgi:hypothetical protein
MNSRIDLNWGMKDPNSASPDRSDATPSGSRLDAERARIVPSSAEAATVSTSGAPLLTIDELSRHSRLSITTLHRLKKAGRLPYFQPAGKGGRLLFPVDAIERANNAAGELAGECQNSDRGDQRLSGPRPAWMR